MIRTQEDYENACAFIDSDMELYDFQLSEKMSSYEYNLYLQDTEYFLNFLYEKIRTLEELCAYLENYTDTKIKTAEEEILQKTTALENTINQYMARQERAIVPDWDTTIPVTDRDGSTIVSVTCHENHLEGAAKKTNYIKPLSVQILEGDMPYARSSDFIKTGNYFSKHKTKEVKQIKEKLRIFLPENAKYNYIEYQPVNANATVTRNKKYIDITIVPDTYRKEKEAFSFEKYKDHYIDHIRADKPINNIPEPQIDKINRNKDKNNKDKIDRYNCLVKQLQKRMTTNNQKSDVIQGT